MTPALETPRLSKLPWSTIVWFGVLLVVAYFPVLRHLIRQCYRDPDMGHAFFVPVISGFIIWQRREFLPALPDNKAGDPTHEECVPHVPIPGALANQVAQHGKVGHHEQHAKPDDRAPRQFTQTGSLKRRSHTRGLSSYHSNPR